MRPVLKAPRTCSAGCSLPTSSNRHRLHAWWVACASPFRSPCPAPPFPSKHAHAQVRYPANLPSLSVTTGATFAAVFGTSQSPLEALLVKRAIRGPGWLGIEQARRTDFGNQSTWTKVRHGRTDGWMDGMESVCASE